MFIGVFFGADVNICNWYLCMVCRFMTSQPTLRCVYKTDLARPIKQFVMR